MFFFAMPLFVACEEDEDKDDDEATEQKIDFEDFTYLLDLEDNTAEIVSYNGKEDTVVVPASVKYNSIRYSIEEIGSKAFEANSAIKVVVIEEGIEEIGVWAFAHCDSLKTVTLPNSLTELSASMFYKCKNLENVTIPSQITEIPAHTFAFCESMTQVDLPEMVDKVKANAFYGCKNVEKIFMRKGFSSKPLEIGSFAFAGCYKITEIWCYDSIPPKMPVSLAADKKTKVLTQFSVDSINIKNNNSLVVYVPDEHKTRHRKDSWGDPEVWTEYLKVARSRIKSIP